MDNTHEIITDTGSEELHPVAVEIVPGTEYPTELWSKVAQSIEAANQLVDRVRVEKRQVELAYEEALRIRALVQIPRDQMIFTDPRTSASVGRLAGIGRARCAQIRDAQTLAEAKLRDQAQHPQDQEKQR